MNKNSEQLIPDLRFPEFVNGAGWNIKELRKIGKTISGLTGKSGDDFGSGKPYVTYKQVFGNSSVNFSECLLVNIGDDENQNVIQKGDVLFTTSSETPDEVAFASVVIEEPKEPTYLNSFCFIYRPEDLNNIDPEFSRYLFRSKIFRELVGVLGQGSTRFNISKSAFLDIILPFPNPKEQQKIASCLSSLDELITAQKEKLELLKNHKKGLMQNLFPQEGETVPKFRFPEFENDRDWEKKKLESLAKRGSGHTPNKQFPEYYNGGVNWVSLSDSKKLDNGYIYETNIQISMSGVKNSSAVLHPAGTVILSRDAGVGKSAVLNSEMAVSQHFIAWVCDESSLSNWFLYYILQILKPVFENIAVGSTIKTIGIPYFKELRIAIPLISEQKKIAETLLSVDRLIQQHSDKIEKLQLHKKGLMQGLFPNLNK